MGCVRSCTPMVGVLSTQSRKVRHKPPRRFLALQWSHHHRLVPTTHVIDRFFIMFTHMTTDVLGSITYNGFATGFGPTPPYAAPGTWVPPLPSYFSARGPPPYVAMGPPAPMTFAPVGPASQMGSYTAAEAGPSHIATPGTSYAIPLSPCNILYLTLIELFYCNIDSAIAQGTLTPRTSTITPRSTWVTSIVWMTRTATSSALHSWEEHHLYSHRTLPSRHQSLPCALHDRRALHPV